MAGVPLFCQQCGTATTFVGDVEVVCPACRQVTTWCTQAPYALTHNDAQFLKSIHITSVNERTS